MTENLGGAGGFHHGVRAAHEQGFDRIWLMDDDVVPAPDCLGVLMAHDEPCLMAVREDRAGALVEKSATEFDLRRPWAVKPKTAIGRDRVRHPRGDARAGGDPQRRLRGLHGAPRGRGSDRAARPGVLHLLRRRGLRPARPARRLPDLGGPRRGARPPARLRPAARPGRLEGLLHVPQPVRRASQVRRERGGARQALADHARAWCCSARSGAAAARRATWCGRSETRGRCRRLRLRLPPA